MASTTRMAASPIKIVIAFDFGTTYSGVSYALNKPGEKASPSPIYRWPGDTGRVQSDVKVPTIISYDPNNSQKFKWGYEVNLDDNSIVGIKLLLDPDQDKPSYLPGSGKKTALKNLPKPAVDIASDYIGAVYNYAMEQIRNRYVHGFIDSCEKQVILTVPAVWSDKAKDLTLKAATNAGLGPLTMIKEPEAAAIYTLSEQALALKKDDIYIICDAGGGTVDLITYEVAQVDPFELVEVVPGSGGMAGAIGLNKRFEEAVRDLIGETQMGALKNIPENWKDVLETFESSIKRRFREGKHKIQRVYFPAPRLEDRPDNNLEDNVWRIQCEDVQEIFDPLVEDVIRLINHQFQASQIKHPSRPIKAILLVGGFGSNDYLKALVTKHFLSDIQVIQPSNASSAVMNGAVMYGLSSGPRVVSRQATCHYGIRAWRRKKRPQDGDRPTWRCPHDGLIRVKKMSWHITKGQELKEDKIKVDMQKKFDHHYEQYDLVSDYILYFSKADSPPVYPDSGVMECCHMRVNLWPARHLMKYVPRGADGRPYWRLKFDLVVVSKANLHFSLEINGIEYGSVDANYV